MTDVRAAAAADVLARWVGTSAAAECVRSATAMIHDGHSAKVAFASAVVSRRKYGEPAWRATSHLAAAVLHVAAARAWESAEAQS